MTKRAIFLDRDGTLNEEAGFLTDLSQLRLFDFSADAVRLINELDWYAIVITNQSGIARGIFDEPFLEQVHTQMRNALDARGARLDAIYYCPHHPEAEVTSYRLVCECRKPKPGMLLRAAREFDLNLCDCFTIGDRYSDVAAAHAAGGRSVMLMSGHGRYEFENQREIWPHEPDHVAENLMEAVTWIVNATS